MSEEYRQELVFQRHNFKMIDKADCRAELFTYVTQMQHSWSVVKSELCGIKL